MGLPIENMSWKRILIAAGVVLTLAMVAVGKHNNVAVPTAAETPRMVLQNSYDLERAQLACVVATNRPGIEISCNYTTKTCLRGLFMGEVFVGDVLAEDRTTVIAHVHCGGSACIRYDDGAQLVDGRKINQIVERVTDDQVRNARAAIPTRCGGTREPDAGPSETGPVPIPPRG
jgi:hypothetical protein